MFYHNEAVHHELAVTLQKLEKAIYLPLVPLQTEAWVTPEPVVFAERESGEHHILSIGQSWGVLWDCAWFHFTGTVPQEADGKNTVLLIDLSGEAYVVDENGVPVLGLTTVSSEFDFSLGRPGKRVVPFASSARAGQRVDLWAEAGCNDLFGKYRDSGTLKEAHIALYDPEMEQLFHDFAVPHELMSYMSKERARYQTIFAALYHASNTLKTYSAEEVKKARAILAVELNKQGGTPSLQISAIGHAHIDLAWLWPLRETIRKGARTFATVLAMMQRYPDYQFGASQPQLYQWMKDYYPELYARVRERIAEGRWEAQGAMWVEPDTNISGGEALVRQVIYGKRFFREEFGVEPRMLWLPDVFGYTAALPQILRKAGVEYFLTIKLSWNTVNRFPHHTFIWQGLDGSRVLAHMPPEGTYNSSAAPRALVATEKNFADKAVSGHAALLYGIGDGGGGPGTEHLERLAREKNLDGLPPVKQEPIERFFERIAQDTSEYPLWNGELYLEKHQGTYTTQGQTKRYNRKTELALRDLEFLAFLAQSRTDYTYPEGELAAIWKEALLYQFHDILPGSSITRVYTEALARYQQLSEQIAQLKGRAVEALITNSDEQTLTVFNTLSWQRREWLQFDGRWEYVTVPSLGYSSLDRAQLSDAREFGEQVASAELLENDLIRVEFAADGSINSIFDKEQRREVLKAGTFGNQLAVYDDEGDAWDFSPNYDTWTPGFFALETAVAHIDGPQVVLEQHYSFGESSLQQRIVLTAGSRRLDFVTRVDWHERNKMLRTRFPVAVHATEATCDIQFGSIKRPTHRNTSWDAAKYEICAHKWVDLSEWDYGVALLNDCKYGHRVHDGVLDLNLLRSPLYPDPQADQGQHEFTYALYPHAGNHLTGGVARAGYELNVPLNVVAGKVGNDDFSFAHVDAQNVIIEACKKAEEGNDLIVRLYEDAGATTRTTLTFHKEVVKVWRTNLLEEVEEELKGEGNEVEVMLQPFEIVTLRVQ